MIKVGGLAAVGAVDAGEALRHRFSCRPVNDGQVGDGRFGPAGLGLWQVMLQGRGLVCQPGYHEVVGHTVTFVLDHGWAYLEKKNQNGELVCLIDKKPHCSTFVEVIQVSIRCCGYYLTLVTDTEFSLKPLRALHVSEGKALTYHSVGQWDGLHMQTSTEC